MKTYENLSLDKIFKQAYNVGVSYENIRNF